MIADPAPQTAPRLAWPHELFVRYKAAGWRSRGIHDTLPDAIEVAREKMKDANVVEWTTFPIPKEWTQ